MNDIEAMHDKATAAIKRVQEVHKPEDRKLVWEPHYPASSRVCAACRVNYPCPTIAALDGAPEPEEKP